MSVDGQLRVLAVDRARAILWTWRDPSLDETRVLAALAGELDETRVLAALAGELEAFARESAAVRLAGDVVLEETRKAYDRAIEKYKKRALDNLQSGYPALARGESEIVEALEKARKALA